VIFHEKNNGGTPVRLKDKVALVTGSGRGIGRDIALAYAREGAHVVINDVDPATADATAKDAAALGSKSLAVVADVAKSADISRLVETVVKERGRIDIVVNNAMKIVPGKLEALPEAAWDTTMNIGLKGAFLVSQAAAKHMIAQKSGAIVNIASIAGLFPYNWAGAYSVVKAGLIMLTKLQAMEWAPYGIRANAITPGYISARPAPRRCMPIRRSTRAGARACRWAGSVQARTLWARLCFSPVMRRVTRPAVW
jgi:NAD(P)-dependent dehydrogenase (short-subunit alcohol dehydrogenase family)